MGHQQLNGHVPISQQKNLGQMLAHVNEQTWLQIGGRIPHYSCLFEASLMFFRISLRVAK
jgi:hypothetical protein